tara:strand:- start:24599 stop:25444 length:846 start_codon:yes stop_codon:yes gene_type:complete
MAKKQETKTEKVAEQPQTIEEPIVEKTVVEKPKIKDIKPKSNTWEIKDRAYYLTKKRKPLSYMVKSANLFWFDEEKGYEREIKYCENQRTPFVDEMKGDQRLSHIIFRNGALFVPKNKTILQKFLSLYHPHRDSLFYEWKPAEAAERQIDTLELEADAIIAARNVTIDVAEAILRVEKGSKVSKMSSEELKRDLLLFARQKPLLFLELVNDDEVQLRNFGIKAVEAKVIKLSSDQRNFLWASNDRKLMTVPFDEHPYTALAHWFKTDEGMEIYSNIEKRLK